MSDEELPPHDNLNVCPDHGVMTHAESDSEKRCPVCRLDELGYDLEVRREAEVPGKPSVEMVTNRLSAEVIVDVVPLMFEYLNDEDEGPLYLTVERSPGELPSGYSEAQDRWSNVLVYVFGGREKVIAQAPSAHETIETLRSRGYGYAEASTQKE